MSDAPLFHIDGATEGTTQWRAETFQLVNWGGFHGHHAMRFSPESTLLSGSSGSGKSTLLDAYLALMMPSDTAFNGASNDASTGRARGADQRNLLSYLRGKTDTRREEGTGREQDRVLRGEAEPTWGALAMTFMDDNGRRYTVLRTYYVPSGATSSADISMRMAVRDGELDLRELEAIAHTRFDKRALKALSPGIDVCASYLEFAQKLHTRLGIGAGGDGSKALRLLARIQAGQQVRTVDGLYKSMVLETPATFLAADKALAHFADLETSYQAMVTEDQKATALERVPALIEQHALARERAATIDTFGVTGTGETPFSLWALGAERALLDSAAEDNAAARREGRDRVAACRDREAALSRRLSEVQKSQRENGGDALEILQNELRALERALDHTRGERAAFQARIAALGEAVDSREDFDRARARAEGVLGGFDAAETELAAARDGLKRGEYPIIAARQALLAERESLDGRAGLVPTHLHAARVEIARAAGLDPARLPFVAELMDVDRGEERWRTAAEVSLASIARIMLVEEDLLDPLSRAIDALPLSTRIVFEGVPVTAPGGAATEAAGDPRRLSAKLVFRESPFSAWVAERVRSPRIDALCVETAAELSSPGEPGPRVTLSGQTRNGSGGAHGQLRERHIIGFSNEARLAEITEEASAHERELGAIAREIADVDSRLLALRAEKDAALHLADARWEGIDVRSAERAIAERSSEREGILESSDVLRTLQGEEERLTAERETAQRERFRAEEHTAALEKRHGDLVDRQDLAAERMEAIERDHGEGGERLALPETERARLAEEFAAVADPEALDGFDAGVSRLRDRLIEHSREAVEGARRAEDTLAGIFRGYQERWPEPNLGTGMASAAGYRAILDTILSTGLHERRHEWMRRLSEWSGQDLVPLGSAFDASIEAIEERLRPVNEILSTLPFGAGRDRLRIALRRLHSEDVAEFRRELRALAAGTGASPSEEETRERFDRLRAFMARISPGADGGEELRERLLDVRRHVEITAVRVAVDGTEISTYSSLGGKSGGESQELIAFIVGAALRFQLGDESRTRPRFAPVFLDEGFVKSDAEFAGRSVAAWRGLGFQLIVGSPLDKVTALEPHMDAMLSMTKNQRTGYSYITALSSAPAPALPTPEED